MPSIVFVNTPSTDLTITDTKASLNVRKLGQYSLSRLDSVEQVRSEISPLVISLDVLILLRRFCSTKDPRILSPTGESTARIFPVI